MRQTTSIYSVQYPLKRRTSHPGEIVADLLLDHDRKGEDHMTCLLGLSEEELTRFLRGLLNVDKQIADKLSQAFGSPPELWLKLQQNFDETS